MKVITNYSDRTSDALSIVPWEAPFSATVDVYHQKIALEMFGRFPHRDGDVAVRFGQNWTTVASAREFAAAILLACGIAEEMVAGTFDAARYTPKD